MGLNNDKSNANRRVNNKKKKNARPEIAVHSTTRRTGSSARTNAYPSRNGLRSSAGVRRSGGQAEHRMRNAAQAEDRKAAGSSSFTSAPVTAAPPASSSPKAAQEPNALRSSRGAESGAKKAYGTPGLYERAYVTVDGSGGEDAKSAGRQAPEPAEETVYWTRSMSEASSKAQEAERPPAESSRKAYSETAPARSAVNVEEVPRETGSAPVHGSGKSHDREKAASPSYEKDRNAA
ncbi:MAG: hypothetical protein IKD86_03040, partial [Firmicutes bacterium]|nr:hypothetical protein [Bacillota bacterium]